MALFFLVMSVCTAIVTAITLVPVWKQWVVVNLEGARRLIFIGIHGRDPDRIIVRPHPLETGTGKPTVYVSPLVRHRALVDPSQDDLRIRVEVQPQGASSGYGNRQKVVATLRLSWFVPEWVPYYRTGVNPSWDHEERLTSLRVPAYRVPQRVKDYYLGSALPFQQIWPHRIDYFVPGAAVVAIMHDYPAGEHLGRIYEVTANHTRELLGSFTIQELQSITKDACGEVDVRHRQLTIRGQSLALNTVPGLKLRFPGNQGALIQAISALLTFESQLELVVFGIQAVVNLASLEFPDRFVREHQRREAMKDTAITMDRFGSQLAQSVGELKEAGMSADIAGLTVAGAAGTDDQPSPFAALAALINSMRGGSR